MKPLDPDTLRAVGAQVFACRAARRRAVLVALAAPLVVGGAAAGLLLALISPPLEALTGLGRWQVFPLFSATGIALALWAPAGTATAGAYLALSRLRPGWARATAAAIVAAAGLALLSAALETAGAGQRDFLEELWSWGTIWGIASAGAAIWLHLAAGFALRRARRGPRTTS